MEKKLHYGTSGFQKKPDTSFLATLKGNELGGALMEMMFFSSLILALGLFLVKWHNGLWQSSNQQLNLWIKKYETRPLKNF